MDLSPAFIAGCKETFPNARMVFDDFHVIKLMNDAINKICIEEARDNEPLKRTKYLWLKNPENLEEWQERKLLQVKDLDIRTAKAYQFKLAVQRAWQLPPQLARRHLRKWIAWAERSRMPEIEKLARTIRSHFDGIVESIRSKATRDTPEA